MTRLVIPFAVLASVGGASAQQADPVILQRLIPALQAQRNEWMDRAALAEARAAQLAEEVQKLKSELEKAKTEKPAQ